MAFTKSRLVSFVKSRREKFKVTRARLWDNVKVVKTILFSSPPLNPFSILWNYDVYFLHKRRKNPVAFVSVKPFDDFHELKSVYTYQKHRGKGYMRRLINNVVSRLKSDVVIQCDSRLERFYRKCGFRPDHRVFQFRVFCLMFLSAGFLAILLL